MLWKALGIALLVLVVAFLFRLSSFGATSREMAGPDWTGGPLAACSDRPNCVSSIATDQEHAIDPLASGEAAAEAMRQAAEKLAAMPGVEIVRSETDYLHAECKSSLFGFVDDLELLLDRGSGVLHVRSASRVGYSDLGANRKRVNSLR